MRNINKIRAKIPYFAIMISALFFLGGAMLYFSSFENLSNTGKCSGQYEFLNPRLKCGERPAISKAGYFNLREKLKSETDQMKKSGKAEAIAVYFRDLQNGPAFGLNHLEKFIPASLLKVPIMITYFKLAESDPEILERSLTYPDADEKKILDQTILPETSLSPGKTYKIGELTKQMIAFSDNRSLILLYGYLMNFSPEINLIEETIKDFGILDPGENISAQTMSAQAYASFFRQLYNSSYLSNEFSDLALKYLSQTTYKGGLRAGVPGNIVIAHKIGERFLEGGQKQLHDCGIIYYPANPYLLCVMTAGADFKELDVVISRISKMFYDEVDSRKL